MPDFSKIPLLDASSIYSDETGAQDDLITKFAKAYSTVGFAYITNHGIDPDLRRKVFQANAAFHAQSMPQKMKVELNHLHRGYIPINTSTDVNSAFVKVTKPNQSASFMLMREDQAADPGAYLSGANQWPELQGFRDVCAAYVTAMSKLANRLMIVALRAAGTDPADFMAAFDTPTTWLRLLHYPPRPDAAADVYGSAPHKDFGCLTILGQDPVGGLQVQTPSGDWVDAPYMPDAYVVNVGDMLHRLSNGRLLSTPHRVINRSGSERYSIPFFYDPHVSTNIAPLPGTGTPRFESVNFGEFLQAELEASYDKHKKSDAKTT
ncbi:MAG: isopenicillin N synthase-like dioxygenase [Paracoccaceae bacterium]|jgi:isopenicillin N synthase-like dioxygenase